VRSSSAVLERAKSFALVAREYDRGRPGYPAAAITWMLRSAPLEVVDLGAGTGKLTAALVEAGHRVIAVEPLAEMRNRLAGALPGVSVVGATAEDTALPDASADAVVAGAAFHWFDTERALGEIARILRPPGALGLLGNGFDIESSGWVRRLADLVGSDPGRGPRHRPDKTQLLEWFAVVDERVFSHEQAVSRATLLNLAQSYSRVAVLSELERRRLLDCLARFWDDDPELRGCEAARLPWRTTVRRCRELRGH